MRNVLKATLIISILVGAAACALGPVENDPAKADERASAMRQDCYARGGTWSETSRTCVGADTRR